MFREMRRSKQALSEAECIEVLKSEPRGVLSVLGDDGYPYAVPINFFYCEEEEKIWFHGAKAGHKIDSIRRDSRVCFTVTGEPCIKEEPWAPFVQSAVVFGRCRLIGDPEEAAAAVRRFAAKYYPDMQMVEEEAAKSGKAVQMFEITIEHLSGKEVQEK